MRARGSRSRSLRIPVVMVSGVVLLVLLLLGAFYRAKQGESRTALADAPKGVTTVVARPAKFRPFRKYVGTVAPWLEARIGPQFTSAYVDTVLFRPGEAVTRGQVLATLDCRNASAQSKALAMQARALSETQHAVQKEAARVSGLLSGGFVSENEVERRTADSSSKQAELLAAQARLSRATLEVDDCVLRAPFAGEVSERLLDPGGFARPGAPILTMVDRSQVRVLLDVPETDFQVVAEKTPVRLRMLATGEKLSGVVARRAPGADASTRTIHAEIDLLDAERRFPVGTTAEATLDVGEPLPALEVPLRAAQIRGETATLFVIADGRASKRKVAVLGESGGSAFVAPTIDALAHIVVEGRSLLSDGDKVTEKGEDKLEEKPADKPTDTAERKAQEAGPKQPGQAP